MRRTKFWTTPFSCAGQILFLALLSLIAAGCGTVRSDNAKILDLPPTNRSFPPVKPGLIRMPVLVTFPQGGLFNHMVNLVKGGIKQVAQETVIRSRLGGLWDKMEKPILLDHRLWLLIHPASISVGEMRADLKDASTLHAVMEMTASPEIVFGPEPRVSPVKMPPLQPFQPGPEAYQAMTNVHIDYEDANLFLRDPRMKIIGSVLAGTGNRKLTIQGIQLSGAGGKVIVEVEVDYSPLLANLSDKPARMTLYLRGTPRYEKEKRIVDLPDLEYDIQSSDLMLQLADLVLKSEFRDKLRKIAFIPVGVKMDILKEKIVKHLNRQLDRYAHVRTEVDSFEILDGFVDNEGLVARVTIKGRASLLVIWR